MLVCVAAGHSLTMMAAIGLIGMAERSSTLANAPATCGLLTAGGAVYLLTIG